MSVVCTAFREFSLAYRIAFLHSFNFRVPAEDTAAPEEHSRWGRIVSQSLLDSDFVGGSTWRRGKRLPALRKLTIGVSMQLRYNVDESSQTDRWC